MGNIPTLPRKLKAVAKNSPAAKFLSQVRKLLLIKRLSKNVSDLFTRIDWIYLDCSVHDELAKVMIFQRNMFCPMGELRTFRYLDTATIVFPDLAEEFRRRILNG